MGCAMAEIEYASPQGLAPASKQASLYNSTRSRQLSRIKVLSIRSTYAQELIFTSPQIMVPTDYLSCLLLTGVWKMGASAHFLD